MPRTHLPAVEFRAPRETFGVSVGGPAMPDMWGHSRDLQEPVRCRGTLLDIVGEGGACCKGPLSKQGEAGSTCLLLKVVTQGRKAPSKSALIRVCLMGMVSVQAAGAGPVNPNKIPDHRTSAPLPHDLP